MQTHGLESAVNGVVVREVCKSFGSHNVLKDVGFSAGNGELFGVIGPDGSGKTTLFNIISGIMPASSGGVVIPTTRTFPCVGYVTQQNSSVDELTVFENVIYSALLQNIDRLTAAEHARSLLDRMDLLRFRDRLAGQLSGGMKQKLALCCALVSHPDVLLLDEPSTGLDPLARRELWQSFVAIAQEGVPILVATPDFAEAEMCDRVLFLHKGKILKCDTPENLRGIVPVERIVIRSSELDNVDQFLQNIHLQQSPILEVVRFGDRIDMLVKPDHDHLWLKSTLASAGFDGVSITPSYPTLENVYSVLTVGDTKSPILKSTADPIADSRGTAIDLNNISKSFGPFLAIRNLTVSVEQAEVFGLLGANGAGKTTTLRMLCGLIRPTEGQITVFGMSPHEHSKRMRSQIGYVNQQFSLYNDLTVEENIEYTARTFRLAGHTLRDNVDWAIGALDLDSVRTTMARSLSRGWKQRVALATAISHRPRALLLDEPTAGTDPEARRRIWRLIRMLTQEGITVLVTTHHLEEAEFCNRIGLLVDGTLIASGTPEKIKTTTAGFVLEVRCADLGAAVEMAVQLVPAEHVLRLPDRLRILFHLGDEGAESLVKRKLAYVAELSLERAAMSLEEAFILRVEEAREKAAA